MQGLITLDFGNSHPHAGLFLKNKDGWNLELVSPLDQLNSNLKKLGLSPHNASMVVCEVKAREEFLNPLIDEGFVLTRVKNYWKGQRFAGMPVNYASTLGEDRLIEAFYLYKKEKCNVLNIDAGTFLTMDVITLEGFQGGYIAPGIKTYFNAYENGERLKSIEVNALFEDTLPKETTKAISESYGAFASHAKELVRKHEIQKIFISGGDSLYWKDALKDLDVTVEPHLIHSSLHYWMTTQIELL
jgi:type III pantothenate kinase